MLKVKVKSYLNYINIRFKGVTMKVFDKVEVRITTEQSGPQHERVRMKLVKPFIEGLSVEVMEQ